jgi:hypothetical protein
MTLGGNTLVRATSLYLTYLNERERRLRTKGVPEPEHGCCGRPRRRPGVTTRPVSGRAAIDGHIREGSDGGIDCELDVVAQRRSHLAPRDTAARMVASPRPTLAPSNRHNADHPRHPHTGRGSGAQSSRSPPGHPAPAKRGHRQHPPPARNEAAPSKPILGAPYITDPPELDDPGTSSTASDASDRPRPQSPVARHRNRRHAAAHCPRPRTRRGTTWSQACEEAILTGQAADAEPPSPGPLERRRSPDLDRGRRRSASRPDGRRHAGEVLSKAGLLEIVRCDVGDKTVREVHISTMSRHLGPMRRG